VLLEFLPQGFDASDYLYYGQRCAEGDCFDRLRPMGVMYWFSIPYRLGVPAQSLMIGHLLLMFVSIALAVMVLAAIIKQRQRQPTTSGLIVFALLSTAIHGFFFYPVLRHSLADAPAGLLFLTGFWLFILGALKDQWRFYLLSGLCFGLAAWMRSFYLYPILFLVAASIVIAVIRPQTHLKKIVLSIALIPIALQFFMVHAKLGYFSYLGDYESREWTERHLVSNWSGYDTDLSTAEGYVWLSPCGKESGGLVQVWQQKNFDGMVCLLVEKTRFYLGSYLPSTYLTPPPEFVKRYNKLKHSERLENIWVWWSGNMVIEADTANNPEGLMEADKLAVKQAQATGNTSAIHQMFGPVTRTPYNVSAWLWSPQPVSVTMGIYSIQHQLIAHQTVTLSDQPVRYSIAFTPTTEELHYLALGALQDIPASFGTTENSHFYAWGVQVTESADLLPYEKELMLDKQRIWSDLLLFANVLVVCLAMLVLLLGFKSIRMLDRLFLLGLLGSIYGLALLLIPEQRFVIPFVVACWQVVLYWSFSTAAGKKLHA